MTHTDESLSLLEQCPAGVCITDSKDAITWCNHSFHHLLGTTPDSVLGKSIDALPVNYKDREHNDASLLSPVDRPGVTLLFSASAHDDGGRIVLLTDVTSAVRPSTGLDIGELANTDLETGLLTAKSTFKQVMTEVTRCRRYGNALSVIGLRVDIDSLGSDQQSKVMAGVGVGVADNLRWVDSAGRWGESTLILVLPETSEDAANLLIKKLQKLLSELSLEPGLTVPVTHFSAVQWTEADDAMGLIERCEQNLSSV